MALKTMFKLDNSSQLLGHHQIALDFKLSSEKRALSVQLARGQFTKNFIGKYDRAVRLEKLLQLKNSYFLTRAPSPSTREPSPFFKSAVQDLTTFLFPSTMSNRKTPFTLATVSSLIRSPILAKTLSDSKRLRTETVKGRT